MTNICGVQAGSIVYEKKAIQFFERPAYFQPSLLSFTAVLVPLSPLSDLCALHALLHASVLCKDSFT